MVDTKVNSNTAPALHSVYTELRDLAGRYLSRERRNHTLQPTALWETGRIMAACRAFEEAESHLLKAWELSRATSGSNHSATERSRASLIRLYEAWGRPERATDLRESAISGNRGN